MLFQNSRERFTPKTPVNPEFKAQVIYNLKHISTNSPWGFACRDFIEREQDMKDEDFRELLQELYTDIEIGPNLMKGILGRAFHFFAMTG